jgi:hypothetical protein
VANTLAYYDTATITAVKSFIVQAPGLFVSQLKLSKNPIAQNYETIWYEIKMSSKFGALKMICLFFCAKIHTKDKHSSLLFQSVFGREKKFDEPTLVGFVLSKNLQW